MSQFWRGRLTPWVRGSLLLAAPVFLPGLVCDPVSASSSEHFCGNEIGHLHASARSTRLSGFRWMNWTPPDTPARSGTPAATFAFVRHGRGVAYFNRQSAIVNQQWMGRRRIPGSLGGRANGALGVL